MNTKIRLGVVVSYALLSPVCLFYAWLFMHLRDPSLPIIPICAALLGLGSAGAAGWNLAELFADMEGNDA